MTYPGKNKAKRLKKIAKQYNFNMAFKKHKTIGNILSRNYKYNTSIEKGLIYSIKCECGDEYIGETSKELAERVKQHKYSIRTCDLNNGIAAHSINCSKRILWEEAEILDWEANWYPRKIKESLWIQRNEPKMNLKPGFTIRGNWN